MTGPIEDGWVSFRDEALQVLPGESPAKDDALKAIRKAFYSGAMWTFKLARDASERSEEEGLEAVRAIDENATAFFDEIVSESIADLAEEPE